MSTNNGRTIKIIGLIVSGAVLIGSAVGSGYKAISEAKDYTDTNIRWLREEQSEKVDKMSDKLAEVQQDVVVIRTILEERFRPKK